MELEITPDWYYIDSLYGCNYINGGTIFVGTNLETLSKKIFETHRHQIKDRLRKFKSVEEIALKTTEHSLTHETLHIVIEKIADRLTSHALDVIDREHEITQYHTLSYSAKK